jgi:hypothetical protein
VDGTGNVIRRLTQTQIVASRLLRAHKEKAQPVEKSQEIVDSWRSSAEIVREAVIQGYPAGGDLTIFPARALGRRNRLCYNRAHLNVVQVANLAFNSTQESSAQCSYAFPPYFSLRSSS